MRGASRELMIKIADYIARTQPLLDAQDERRDAFVKRAAQAASLLADRGVIDPRRVNEFVDKVADDPQSVWAFVEKLASSLAPAALGEGVGRKGVPAVKADAFERLFFGIGVEKSGMVD